MKKSASSVPEFPDDFKRYHFSERDSYALIGRFEEVRVALIGDTGIIDEYILCVPVGMPREEPVIVVTPRHNQRFIGGAAIVLACDAAFLGAPPLYINRI